MSIDWTHYDVGKAFDEFRGPRGGIRKSARPLAKYLAGIGEAELTARNNSIALAIKEMGVSFTVYSEDDGILDRAWPLDLIPRIVARSEWDGIARGLRQRAAALNALIDDIYHEQVAVHDGVFPAYLFESSTNFLPECMGVSPPLGIWAHICGTDLVRADDGKMYVLEDNLRVPSGISYVLENRLVMKQVFPELFESYSILTRRRLPIAAIRYLGGTFAAPGRLPGDRRADAGDLQFGLLRARLSRPTNGCRACRRPRSSRRFKRLCLYAHHTRARPRGCHLPAYR